MRTANELAAAIHAAGYRDGQLARMRELTADDVARAFKDAYIALPLTEPAQMVEFFNRLDRCDRGGERRIPVTQLTHG